MFSCLKSCHEYAGVANMKEWKLVRALTEIGRSQKPGACLSGIAILAAVIAVIASGCSLVEVKKTEAPPQAPVNQTLGSIEMTLLVDNPVYTAQGLNMHVRATVVNPNSSSIDIDNIQLQVQGENGFKYQDTVTGGPAKSLSITEFDRDVSVPAAVLSERNLIVKASSRAMLSGAILPLNTAAALKLADISVKTLNPNVSLLAKVTKLVQIPSGSQIEARVEGAVQNPNPTGMDIGPIQITVKDKTGHVLNGTTVTGGGLRPGGSCPFNANLVLPVECINDKSTTFEINSLAYASGTETVIRKATDLQFSGVQDFILVPSVIVESHSYTDYVDGNRSNPAAGLQVWVTLKNDNWFNVYFDDIHVNVFRPPNKLAASAILPISVLPAKTVPGNSFRNFNTILMLSPEVVGSTGGEATISVETKAGIQEVDQKFGIIAKSAVQLKPVIIP
jgi:hypothetical protein